MIGAQIGGEERAVLGQAFGIVADHQRVWRNARNGNVGDVNMRRTVNLQIAVALNEHRHVESGDVVLLERSVEPDVVGGDDHLGARTTLRGAFTASATCSRTNCAVAGSPVRAKLMRCGMLPA